MSKVNPMEFVDRLQMFDSVLTPNGQLGSRPTALSKKFHPPQHERSRGLAAAFNLFVTNAISLQVSDVHLLFGRRTSTGVRRSGSGKWTGANVSCRGAAGGADRKCDGIVF
jgi:hypothetical protein